MSKFELLIFDLDGTLIDSSPDIVITMNKTLGYFDRKQLTKSEILKHIGFGSEYFIKKCMGGRINSSLFMQAHRYYMRYYSEHVCVKTRPYKGAEKTLQVLHRSNNHKMVVFTNRLGMTSRRILSLLKLDKYFEQVIGYGDGFRLKPDTKVISYWLKRFSIVKDRALLIGDSGVDVNTGKRARVKTCLVKFGYGKYFDNISSLKPDYTVASFPEILKIV